jgi:hypothetical protein
MLTGSPILWIVDLNEYFVVCIDACKEELGGVLSQNGFVICFESIKLKERERLYASHDLELEAIVNTLKKWRHYLMGKRFELRKNHNCLKYLFDQPTLNARHSRWLEFLCEYDFDVEHIKGKENKVDDALNRRVHELHVTTISMYLMDLKGKISENEKVDLQYMELVTKLQQGKMQQKDENYELGIDGIILYINIFYVTNYSELKSVILKEMHNVFYAGHLGCQKTISVVKSQYYWLGMKREIVEYIDKCLECERVKGKHRHPDGLLQPLPIPKWKWEVVTMDFILGFPRTSKQHDAIMVVMEKLTKASHFIPMKVTHKETNVVDIYIREVEQFHNIPKTIVSERDPKFTSNVWRGLLKGFGMNLNFSTTYHPESDGKIERVNQLIKDMIRMYVMDKPSKWEDYLYLVEFSYNNGYQSPLKMRLFEAIYDRKCNTTISWDNPTDRAVVGPELLKEMEEQLLKIKKKFKASQDRKKKCSNKGRTHREKMF